MHDYDIVIGDVTDPLIPQWSGCQHPQTLLIPHVVNNVGAFGAGVALVIKNKWPKAAADYRMWFEFWQRHKRSPLGRSFGSVVEQRNELTIVVVHMFAQVGVRRPDNQRPLDYGHLQSCMEMVPKIGTALEQPFTIHCPRFGTGLGGGTWKEIEKMIRATWCSKDIPVWVYSYRKGHEQEDE